MRAFIGLVLTVLLSGGCDSPESGTYDAWFEDQTWNLVPESGPAHFTLGLEDGQVTVEMSDTRPGQCSWTSGSETTIAWLDPYRLFNASADLEGDSFSTSGEVLVGEVKYPIVLEGTWVGTERVEGTFIVELEQDCHGAWVACAQGSDCPQLLEVTQADILLVADNAASEEPILTQLREDVADLVGKLLALGVDFRIGVLTSDVGGTGNGTSGIILSADRLGADTCGPPVVITPETEDPAAVVTDLLDVLSDYSNSNYGEYAAALAMCRGMSSGWWDELEERPDSDPVRQICSIPPVEERQCNEGFFRDGVRTVVITVSNRGDRTARLSILPSEDDLATCVEESDADPVTAGCDCRVDYWAAFMEGIREDVRVFAMGPTYTSQAEEVTLCDGTTASYAGPCYTDATSACDIDLPQRIACLTSGRFFPFKEVSDPDEPGTCEPVDVGATLAEMADMITWVGVAPASP